MVQPQGFVDSERPHHVCHLRCSLYGLKQAPRAWYQWLRSYLTNISFLISTTDSSLFIHHSTSYNIFLSVYVDDIILIGSPNAPLSALLHALHGELAIKDLGLIRYFLGIEVQSIFDGLHLHQAKFTRDS